MKVCAVWDWEYPWDVRVEKACLSLTEAGHDVHLVARNRRGGPLVESYPEATVHRMPPLGSARGRLNDLSSFPAFFNPRWKALIRSTAITTGAHVIICRDLPLAPAAVSIGRSLGVPVVLDMAENYPAMIRAMWEHGRHRATDWLVRNPAAVRAVERWVLRRVDHVIVVVEESRDRLVALGVPESRISVVRNTPMDRRIPRVVDRAPATPPLRLVYIGILEVPRGLGVVLDAIARCREHGMAVHCSVVGAGRDAGLFTAQARRLDLTEREVTFHGHLPYERALELVGTAHIGIVPHFANESWNSTIPNKLFDYMAAALPVITSDARPAARIVTESGCGEVYLGQDPEHLVRAIQRLADPATRQALGCAGRAAVLGRYRWSHDGTDLVRAVERVVTVPAPAGQRRSR